MLKLFKIVCCTFALIIMMGQNLIHANDWNPNDWFEKKSNRNGKFLIITGNYLKSRILAELIQHDTGQPILLLPTPDHPETFYALSSKGNSLKIEGEHYENFVSVLQVDHVLFIGNEAYTPKEFRDRLLNRLTIWSIEDNDWLNIARSIGMTLSLSNLSKNYQTMLSEVKKQQLALSAEKIASKTKDNND